MSHQRCALLLLLTVTIGSWAPARADLYFNSSEPGCGTDPTVVWCDDFERGEWGQTDQDGVLSSTTHVGTTRVLTITCRP
jgi:hypothetical protein